MRVVVDTNVVVSAILRDRLPEKILVFILGHPDFEWAACAFNPDLLLPACRRKICRWW